MFKEVGFQLEIKTNLKKIESLNAQRKSISTTVRKEPKTYGLIHHFLKPLKLMLENHSSDYWTNIFQSLTRYTRSFTETPSKLVIVV